MDNSSLEILDLQDNNIDDKAITEIAEGLKKNNTLNFLGLEGKCWTFHH
jgi:Ran GTPase-activating protein (RanGAP) involved in mRNA processing and transport